jgi:glycosyltransferase involved in cell wall biosynthesis
VLNAFTHDSRVLRSAGLLLVTGTGLSFALHEELLPEREEMASDRPTIPLENPGLVEASSRRYSHVECALRMVWRGVAERPRVVQAHDLEALPIGFLIARLARARLVYDSHELWEDVTSVREYPPLLLRLLLFLERFLARRADAVITVSEGIARRMARQMQIRQPAVVRNVPWSRSRTTRTSQPLRDAQLIHRFRSPHQGRSVRLRRDILIDAMQHVVAPAVAVLLGTGRVWRYAGARGKTGVGTPGALPQGGAARTVLDFTADGTIASLIRDLSLSYRYCSNKPLSMSRGPTSGNQISRK